MNLVALDGCDRSQRPPIAVAGAVAVTAAALGLGFWAFGLVTTFIFTAGFAGGLLLWLMWPSGGGWSDVRMPYWVALALFVAHRVEEKQMGFFAFLAVATGEPTPSVTSVPVLLLVGVSVGAWLLVPILMRRGRPMGRYLAWTFFASLGISELAHFVVFPWIDPAGIGYVPGMWSVIALAPVAWWGMWRLVRGRAHSATS